MRPSACARPLGAEQILSSRLMLDQIPCGILPDTLRNLHLLALAMEQLHRLPHLLRRESVALADGVEEGLADLETPGVGKGAVLVLLKCWGLKLRGCSLSVGFFSGGIF